MTITAPPETTVGRSIDGEILSLLAEREAVA